MNPRLVLASAALLSAGIFVTRSQGPAPQTAAAPSPARPAPTDAPLEPFRKRLLDVAFDSVTRLPLVPHVKERSRLQEEVVTAALALDQSATALADLEQIDNWRRGSAYAALALHGLEHGQGEAVRPWLERALTIADQLATRLAADDADQELEDDAIESPQDWQRDRIRVQIAKALLVHGETERAGELAAGLADSEAGELDVYRARLTDEAGLEARLAALDALVTGASLERARHALEACAELYVRFHGDPERRVRVEQVLLVSGAKLPPDIQVDVLARCADAALQRADMAGARGLIDAARARLDGVTLTPESEIPLRACLAALRHRAGDAAGARAEFELALERYEQQRATIADVFRAETLVPLAEAATTLDGRERARALYGRALEEAALNPNARPRAEDLAGTCLSLARLGLEPDAELWRRIYRLHDQLGAPW